MAPTNELLLDRLSVNTKKNPSKLAITYLAGGPNGGKVERQLTYDQLTLQTDALAQRLVEQEKIQQGDRVVLVYPPSADYMVAFLACLKAGFVAVPVFPPNPTRNDTLKMFTKIVEGCDAKYALTNSEYNYMKKIAGIKQGLASAAAAATTKGTAATTWPDDLKWIVTSSGTKAMKKPLTKPLFQPTASDLAFLQYTSGSTSSPKGVMITHGNLAHNLTIITNELKAKDDTIVVSWLPQYHDMGLIGSYLGCLYCGGSGNYMSPLSFLQRPMLWVEAISKYRATHLQAPNFAFALLARKYNSSVSLDLSSVRHVINAAEPVTEESIETFLNKFTQHGFNPKAMYPTYGLAEHTVFVCSGGTQRLTVDKEQLEVHGKVLETPPEDPSMPRATVSHDSVEITTGNVESSMSNTRLLGCGYPARQGVTVKIVDRESNSSLKEDMVGEIWVSSPSKAAGYFHQPEETKEDFHAKITGDNTLEYLRTGDLGFLHNDELFICGRIKDLIIVGGRNYYPQDLEATADAVDSEMLRAGRSAAFTIDPTRQDGGEEVAMVLELRTIPSTTVSDSLATKIRGAVNREHSLGIAEIWLLKPGTVPKTSSGKIARAWCRKGFLADTLDVVYKKSFRASNGGTSNGAGRSPLEVENGAPKPKRAAMTPEDISKLRAMSRKDILARLKEDVSQMGGMPLSAITNDAALATMLDSLSIAQFKGQLESHYAVKISDEYLFRESSTLNKLVEVVRLGYAPDDGEEGAGGAAIVSSEGNAGGLAGALGCPPGVRCVIM